MTNPQVTNRTILQGDVQDKLKGIETNSIDLITTDPPYFLLNSSGKGFMGKDWDSINIKNTYDMVCRSKELANFAVKFFELMRIESNTVEESTVQGCVNIQEDQLTKDNSNVQSVKNHLKDIVHQNQNLSSAHLVITGGDLWDLLKELLENHTTSHPEQNPFQNALYVIPHSILVKKLKGITLESVLKYPIKSECQGKEIHLTLMDEVRINAVIETMIGIRLEKEYTKEIDGNVESVKNIATKKRYRLIILSLGEKQKITQWLTLLLYATYVTQKLNRIPTSIDLQYELMGEFHKSWMIQSLRVLKPGAFAYIMCAPRQDVLSIMMQCCKDAGFVTNFTSIYWAYANGFPKAANISKMIDKKLGEKRERQKIPEASKNSMDYKKYLGEIDNSNPISIQAKKLNGSYAGFQPKPAVEVILVVMKPLSEKNYVEQAMSNGKGVTWLDDCRIPSDNNEHFVNTVKNAETGDDTNWKKGSGFHKEFEPTNSSKGRFPANLLVSDDALHKSHVYGDYRGVPSKISYGNSGSFSRYFDLDKWDAQFIITPKASKSEKNKGLDSFMENSDKYKGKFPSDKKLKMKTVSDGRATPSDTAFQRGKTLRQNTHPTVKPVSLFKYLITMGSREGDVVLDPFMGSGTTAIAAEHTAREWIGIEKNPEYVEIFKARLDSYRKQNKLEMYN